MADAADTQPTATSDQLLARANVDDQPPSTGRSMPEGLE